MILERIILETVQKDLDTRRAKLDELRLSMSPVKPRSVFFTPPGAISVVQCWPSDGFHHKVYDLSTSQK